MFVSSHYKTEWAERSNRRQKMNLKSDDSVQEWFVLVVHPIIFIDGGNHYLHNWIVNGLLDY